MAEFYVKIEEDWERFWKLDPRVDTYHFAALLIHWDDPKNKVYIIAQIISLVINYLYIQ